MTTPARYAQLEESARLVRHVTNTCGCKPTIRDGVAVFDAGSDIAITPETIAALAYTDNVIARGTVVPRSVAEDAATTLCGMAALNAATGGAR